MRRGRLSSSGTLGESSLLSGIVEWMSESFGYVSLEELLDWVRSHPLQDGRFVPVCIWGQRGVGKTQQLRSYTKSRELSLRTMQPSHLSGGADLVGIPFIDQATRKTVYALPERLPKDGDPDVDRGGILFLDEINRGSLEVLQGLMQVIGEGEIGQSGWKLPAGWMVVAAANPNVEGYDVRKMDDAMIGRMLHYSPGFNVATWVAWATESGIPERVTSFVLQNPDLVDSGQSVLPPEVNPTLNPRTAEYFGSLYADDIPEPLLRVVATGLWGDETATEMLSHHREQVRPLSGIQVLSGGWGELLGRWVAANRDDLIRASTEYMIAALRPRAAVRSNAANEAARWLSVIPAQEFIDAVVSLSESAPQWLPLLLSYGEFRLEERFPSNRNLLRRTADRDVASRRLARSEQRLMREAQAAAQRRTQLHSQPALPPAQAETVRRPATGQHEAEPAAPSIDPAPTGAPRTPTSSPATANPSPRRPRAVADIAPLSADDIGETDEELPFQLPDSSKFNIPDI